MGIASAQCIHLYAGLDCGLNQGVKVPNNHILGVGTFILAATCIMTTKPQRYGQTVLPLNFPSTTNALIQLLPLNVVIA